MKPAVINGSSCGCRCCKFKIFPCLKRSALGEAPTVVSIQEELLDQSSIQQPLIDSSTEELPVIVGTALQSSRWSMTALFRNLHNRCFCANTVVQRDHIFCVQCRRQPRRCFAYSLLVLVILGAAGVLLWSSGHHRRPHHSTGCDDMPCKNGATCTPGPHTHQVIIHNRSYSLLANNKICSGSAIHAEGPGVTKNLSICQSICSSESSCMFFAYWPVSIH